MNNTLFCIYDGQKYLAEPIDDNHIYVLVKVGRKPPDFNPGI